MESVLARAPLFAALDADSFSHPRGDPDDDAPRAGHVVFREGDTGDRLFLVLDGKVKISRGRRPTAGRTCSRSWVAARCSASSRCSTRPRTATATTVTEATLASLDHDDLRPLLTERPGVAVQLLQALAQRLRRTNEAMADLVFSDVPGRVAKALLDLAREVRRRGGDGLRVAPRPHPGRARAAGRRQPRNGQQGAVGVRPPRLAADRGPQRPVARPRALARRAR